LPVCTWQLKKSPNHNNFALEAEGKMTRSNENWSQVIREMIRQRIEEEGEMDMVEAIILNEKARRPAPKNWSSLQMIKQWRRRTSA